MAGCWATASGVTNSTTAIARPMARDATFMRASWGRHYSPTRYYSRRSNPAPIPGGPAMKLVRFSTHGQTPRLGALQGERVADLQASLAATLTRRGVVRAQEIAAALVPQ